MTDPSRNADLTWVTCPPERVPTVGAVLRLDVGQWAYGGRPITVRVVAARPDISVWYGGAWCWIDADELDTDGRIIGRLPVLVRVNERPRIRPTGTEFSRVETGQE